MDSKFSMFEFIFFIAKRKRPRRRNFARIISWRCCDLYCMHNLFAYKMTNSSYLMAQVTSFSRMTGKTVFLKISFADGCNLHMIFLPITITHLFVLNFLPKQLLEWCRIVLFAKKPLHFAHAVKSLATFWCFALGRLHTINCPLFSLLFVLNLKLPVFLIVSIIFFSFKIIFR